jgi:predicted RNA-binding protein with PIN domain
MDRRRTHVIFAHPALESLQTQDRKGEARRRLEQMFERLAALYGLQVQIVYDGNRMERNPDTYKGSRVSSLYTLAPEEADDRILWLVEGLVSRGRRVAVVSSDRATLGSRLPVEGAAGRSGGAVSASPSGGRRTDEVPAIR